MYAKLHFDLNFIAACRKLRKLRGPHCRRRPTNCPFRSESVCYIVKTQRWPRPFPYVPSSPPFRFYGHARTVLRPTYVSQSRRSDTRRKRTALRERILFPLPECSTNVVARVMEVAEPAIRKPAGEEAAVESSPRSIQGGR